MRLAPFRPGRRPPAAALALAVLLSFGAAVQPGRLAEPVRAADDAAYVAGIQDLPLMPGLAEVPEAGVVFDKPSGRIVEAYAEGALSRAAVTAFYRKTLPQLGWRARGATAFSREGEQLELVILGGDGDLIVRFTLQPE
ncbi:MAG: hypothetical protein ACE5KF_07280 [Kiloniellaceae bacterium]